MANNYQRFLKPLLLLTFYLTVSCLNAQIVPQYIKVAGFTSPNNGANGIYENKGIHGTFDHAYWKQMTGEFYLFSDNLEVFGDNTNFWNLDTDLDDENNNAEAIVFATNAGGQEGIADDNIFKTFVSPTMMTTWYLTGVIPANITLTQVNTPSIITSASVSVTTSSANLGGNISSNNGDGITTRGVVYSSTDNTPTIGETDVVVDNNGYDIGSFSETITGLTSNTTYYYQAYATNGVGTTYGGVMQFTTEAIPAPSITSVTVPANTTYKINATLNFTVNYDQTVAVTGTPQLPITLNTGGTVYANYVSGSGTSALKFSYTVVSGNLDADGITVGSSLSLNAGTIKNGTTDAALSIYGVATTTGVKVDGVRASVTIALSDAALKTGETSTVTFTFSEWITSFPLGAISATHGTIAGLTTTDNIIWKATFTPSASTTANTNAIIVFNDAISDAAGNTGFSITGSPNYTIDTQNPTVSITSSAADPTNLTAIPVTVTFSESAVNFAEGDIVLTNGTISSFAGSGATYTFNVTPTAQGAVTVAIAASVAQDVAGNNNTAATSLTRIFDGIAPTITTVTPPANGYYKTGNYLTFTINLTESVTVTGSPYLSLTIGSTTKQAAYQSGSGTSALVFRYTAASNDLGDNGITLSSFVANGATLTDEAGNNAIMTLSSTTYSNVKIDNIPPAVGGVSNGATYTATVTPSFTEGTAILSKNGATAVAYTSNTAISTTGNYTLVVTDVAGNSNTVTFTISIATATEEKSATAILLYPNPCTEGFHINIGEEAVKLTITDLAGRQVLEQIVTGNDYVATSQLKAGIYIVKAGTFATRLRVK